MSEMNTYFWNQDIVSAPFKSNWEKTEVIWQRKSNVYLHRQENQQQSKQEKQQISTKAEHDPNYIYSCL